MWNRFGVICQVFRSIRSGENSSETWIEDAYESNAFNVRVSRGRRQEQYAGGEESAVLTEANERKSKDNEAREQQIKGGAEDERAEDERGGNKQAENRERY